MSTAYGKRVHTPQPSLIPHICPCGDRDSDPTWHRQPVAGVSPLREEERRHPAGSDPRMYGVRDDLPRTRSRLGHQDESTTAVARRTDPSTSWEAARSVSDLTTKQQQVLWLFRTYGGMTDYDLERRHFVAWQAGHVDRQKDSGLRTRRSELVRAGLLRWTGETKIGTTGRKMRVWEAA